MFGLLRERKLKKKLRETGLRWKATWPLWKITYRTPSGDHKSFLVRALNRVGAVEAAFERASVPYSSLVSVTKHKGDPGKWDVL